MEVQQTPINPQDQHNRQAATASLPRRQDQAAKLKAATEALRLERNVPAPQEASTRPDVQQNASKGENESPESSVSPKVDELLAKYEKARNDAQDRENRALAATRQQEKISADTAAKLAKLAEAKDDPVGFLSALGLSEDEWKEMLANGGKPTPAMKALSAMQSRIEESDRRQQALEAQLTKAREDTEIETFLPRFPLLKKLGGADAARNYMTNLRAQGSQMSYLDAMTALETQFNEGLSAVLRDDEINAKYNYKSKSAPPSAGSNTLGTQHTSTSAPVGEDKNPFPVNSRQHREFQRNLAIQRLSKIAR